MANILLTRVDNRLVHGQVGVTWVRHLGANLIVVADDETAQDELAQKLMSFTATSSGVGIRFFTCQKTIDVIHKANAKQLIFLVVKSPAAARKLIEGGVEIQMLNLGNLHFSSGKKEISKKVYLNEQDEQDLKAILAHGTTIFIQDVPGDKIIEYKP